MKSTCKDKNIFLFLQKKWKKIKKNGSATSWLAYVVVKLSNCQTVKLENEKKHHFGSLLNKYIYIYLFNSGTFAPFFVKPSLTVWQFDNMTIWPAAKQQSSLDKHQTTLAKQQCAIAKQQHLLHCLLCAKKNSQVAKNTSYLRICDFWWWFRGDSNPGPTA